MTPDAADESRSAIVRLSAPRTEQSADGQWSARFQELVIEGRGSTAASAIEALQLELGRFLDSPKGLEELRTTAVNSPGDPSSATET